jgi:hypothetical protein
MAVQEGATGNRQQATKGAATAACCPLPVAHKAHGYAELVGNEAGAGAKSAPEAPSKKGVFALPPPRFEPIEGPSRTACLWEGATFWDVDVAAGGVVVGSGVVQLRATGNRQQATE